MNQQAEKEQRSEQILMEHKDGRRSEVIRDYGNFVQWESQRDLQEADGDAEGTRTGTGDLLLDAAVLTRFHRPQAAGMSDHELPVPGVGHDIVTSWPSPYVNNEYFMSHRERGVALIFSHINFDVRQHQNGQHQPAVREGTVVDRDTLRHAFTMLGFEVLCFNDRTYEEIISELRLVSEQNHGSRDCLVVAVLTHCGGGGQLEARDRAYHVSELWRPLTPRRCPSLDGKPKLFFIQASGGRNLDIAVNSSNIISSGPGEGRDSYADILVSYSTFDGATSTSDTQNASRFVQTLHDELRDYGRSKDLVSLLTDVNLVVSQQVRLHTDREHLLHGGLHQPCFTSTLTRRLRFR